LGFSEYSHQIFAYALFKMIAFSKIQASRLTRTTCGKLDPVAHEWRGWKNYRKEI